jgi:hypothetical protein
MAKMGIFLLVDGSFKKVRCSHHYHSSPGRSRVLVVTHEYTGREKPSVTDILVQHKIYIDMATDPPPSKRG